MVSFQDNGSTEAEKKEDDQEKIINQIQNEIFLWFAISSPLYCSIPYLTYTKQPNTTQHRVIQFRSDCEPTKHKAILAFWLCQGLCGGAFICHKNRAELRKCGKLWILNSARDKNLLFSQSMSSKKKMYQKKLDWIWLCKKKQFVMFS